MAARIISSLVGLPLIVAVILWGGNYLKVFLCAVILMALSEVYRAFSKKPLIVHGVGYLYAIIYMFMIDDISKPNVLTIIICLFTISSLMMLVFFHDKITVIDTVLMIVGFYYVVILMSTIYLIRIQHNGQFFVWLSFISAWGCDTGAYFTGITFGKHKLVPKLSPKKTVEGAVGGVIVATLLAAAYGVGISWFFEIDDMNFLAFCVTAGFVGSILAQFGDLTASAIKRYTGVKDYGRIIPGHGGIMDRFDSILFTAPAIYIVMIFLPFTKIAP